MTRAFSFRRGVVWDPAEKGNHTTHGRHPLLPSVNITPRPWSIDVTRAQHPNNQDPVTTL
jgi:hypothetical protein